MDNLRVFVSSPGDVAVERTLVSQVINLLRIEFDDRVQLEAVLWEQEALLATSTFQDQICLPSECDIAVFILGDHFGTPLPAKYQREDGSRYLSGTEFEFEDAVAGFHKNGHPHILVYRKSRDQYINLNDSNLDEILSQRRELNKFIEKWFLDDNGETFSGAFHTFISSDEFEQLVETHLYKLINQVVETQSKNQLGIGKRWFRGNPYLGLNSFRYEHAQIYFGRTRAISECIDLLHQADDSRCPFLLVLGMSGGGKSSLAHAGIVPMLIRRGIDRGIRICRWISIRPVEQRGEIVQHLASSMINQLTELEDSEKEKFLETAKTASNEELAALLIAVMESEKADDRERFILVVDQFEELFTSSFISNSERNRFIQLLNRLVRESPVWCISTLRSDFYPEFTKDTSLIALKNDGAQYDLPAPSASEISLMIRGPAIAAGLHFERDSDTGEHLDEKARKATENNPEILPLLEYTLAELYENRDEDGWLTNKAYQDLGGVEGALAKSAEHCFASLSTLEQQSLPIVFNALLEFSADGSIGRCHANVEDFEARHARVFLDAFVAARLFVMELDYHQQQIVTVAHESLFRYWPRLSDWVENNKDQLKVRSRVNTASELWLQQGQSTDLLLGRGKPAAEAGLLLGSGLSLTDATQHFIEASLARVQLNRQLKYGGFILVILFAVVAGVAAYLANLSNQDSLRRLAQNDDLVTFMLDDLIEQLRPIGRLEPIRIVGEKAIDYFETIDDEDRTDIARLKHAQALHQIGENYFDAGKFNDASQAFAESLRHAKILHEQDPQNTDREFELGQAYFWVGRSNLFHEDLVEAEKYFLLYFEVSESLVSRNPDNVNWQMELGFAYQNLGVLEESRQQYTDALGFVNSAIQVFFTLAESFPDRKDIERELAGFYSWTGTIYRNMGDLRQSLSYFLREEEITRRLVNENDDANWRYSMVHAHRHLGEIYLDTGMLNDARDQFLQGLTIVNELVIEDDQNTQWIYGKALCNYYLAEISIYLSDFSDAQDSLKIAGAAIGRLDNNSLNWRILDIRELLLSATLKYETAEITAANDFTQQASENVNELLEQHPNNLQLRALALRASLTLAMQNEDGNERAQKLEFASDLITSDLLESDRPDDLIAMLMFYAYRGDEREQLINYRDKLERYGIKHPEISRILSTKMH